jgi:3-oxoadipate CoA-transferase beta subunit
MTSTSHTIGLTRDQMAERAARDIPDRSYVNLGIGIPELVASHVPEGREFIYHTENG